MGKLNIHLVKLCLEAWRSQLTWISILNIVLMLTLSTGVGGLMFLSNFLFNILLCGYYIFNLCIPKELESR